jgi:hypothetical protein
MTRIEMFSVSGVSFLLGFVVCATVNSMIIQSANAPKAGGDVLEYEYFSKFNP